MTRLKANQNYQSALVKVRATEMGTDAEAYASAILALDVARKALVESELTNPTRSEAVKARRSLRLANRGLDIF